MQHFNSRFILLLIFSILALTISCSVYKTTPGHCIYYPSDLNLLDSAKTSASLDLLPGKMRRSLKKLKFHFTNDSAFHSDKKHFYEDYLFQCGTTKDGKVAFLIYMSGNDSIKHFHCDILHVTANTIFRNTFSLPVRITNWQSARKFLAMENQQLFGGGVYTKRQERKFHRKMKRKQKAK